ncbi:AP complex mu/sigma subunit [Penicillium capsulatum]|uniref:AP-2 complex subunit sigma n=6 Tax=Penicillium TaxID=5073 RepID=A0A9W9LKG2_9EURO|nr:AP complex mu/sigma subunit [Penicillium capsulatum]KAJ6116946.1 AP complex mu/sigma subunit [Penicillium capsulatum]
MPVYMLHGFRWPRGGFTGIRVYIVLHNLEDAAAEYIQQPLTSELLVESLQRTNADLIQRLPQLQFIEQYDPADETSNTVSQDYAYVGVKVLTIPDGGKGPGPGHNLEKVVEQGSGLSPDATEALDELRNRLAPGEKIGWFMVYNGDPERYYPSSDEDEDEFDDESLTDEKSEAATEPGTPQSYTVWRRILLGFFFFDFATDRIHLIGSTYKALPPTELMIAVTPCSLRAGSSSSFFNDLPPLRLELTNFHALLFAEGSWITEAAENLPSLSANTDLWGFCRCWSGRAPVSTMVLSFILVQNRQGKTRLAKWYAPYSDEEKVKLKGEVHRLVAPRDQKYQSNFVEFRRSTKVVYRRYAGLFFCVCVDANDNELAYLEAIHFFVEVLDQFFGNVCELDLVFNFYKVYAILDEVFLAGEIEETSKQVVLTRLEHLDKLE